MDRTIPTWHSRVVVVAILVAIISVVGVGVGAVAVNGFLWSVGEVDNIQISSEENQTVSKINVYSEDHPVKVEVGGLVDVGAEFDSNESSYDIKNGQQAKDGEVFIKNPKTTNATVVINSSALDSSETFDLEISDIDTTRVSSYEQDLSTSDNEVKYVTKQDGAGDESTFSVISQANISVGPDSYNNTTKEISLESVELTDNTSSYVVVWERSTEGNLKNQLGSIQKNKNSVKINNSSIEGKTKIAVAVHPGEEGIQTKTIHAIDTTTIISPVSVELVDDPIYYKNGSSQVENNTDTILFEFNTLIDSHQGEISIEFVNGSKSTVEIGEDTNKYSILGRYVRIFPHGNQSLDKETNKPASIENISVKNVSAEIESDSLTQNNRDVRRIGKSIQNTTKQTVSKGTNFGVISNSSNNISLNKNGQNVKHDFTNDLSKIHSINTEGVSPGNYTILSDGKNNGTQIEIINTSLSAEIPAAATRGNVSMSVSSIKTDRRLIARLYDKNRTIRVVSEEKIRGGQDDKITLEVPKKGEYKIQIKDVDTGDTKSQSIEVLERRSAEIQLLSNPDVISISNNIPIELGSMYSNTSLKLVDTNSNSTAATINLSTPQKGNTAVEFNTYTAANGSLADAIVTADDTVTVDSVETETPNETLSPGTYELAVQSEHGDASTENATTFTLRSRSTNGITSYATDKMDPTDLKTADAIRSAVTDGTLSPTSTVGPDQTVVYAVNASGLTGLPAAENATLDTGSDLREFSGFSFGVQPTASTELSTADGTDALGEVPDDSTVHIDESRLYVATNGTDAFGADDPPSDGEEFTATFRVDDDNLRATATDPPDDHSVTTTLSYADPDNGPSDGDDGTRAVGDGGSATGGSPTGGSSAGAGGGSTGGGSAGSGPPSDGVESNTGPSAADPAGPSDDGVVPPRGSDATYAEYGAGIRHVTSQQTPHPTVPAAIRFSSTANDAPADSDRSATPANTAQDQPRDGTDDRDEIREPDAPRYDDAPIRSTAYDVPGFGPVVTLTSLVTAVFFATRRQ